MSFLTQVKEFMEQEEKKQQIFHTIELLFIFYCYHRRRYIGDEDAVRNLDDSKIHFAFKNAVYLEDYLQHECNSKDKTFLETYWEQCIQMEEDPCIQFQYFLLKNVMEKWACYLWSDRLFFDGQFTDMWGYSTFICSMFPYPYSLEIRDFLLELEEKNYEEELEHMRNDASKFQQEIESIKQYDAKCRQEAAERHKQYAIYLEHEKIDKLNKKLLASSAKEVQLLLRKIDLNDVVYLLLIVNGECDYWIRKNITLRLNAHCDDMVTFCYSEYVSDPVDTLRKINEILDKILS